MVPILLFMDFNQNTHSSDKKKKMSGEKHNKDTCTPMFIAALFIIART